MHIRRSNLIPLILIWALLATVGMCLEQEQEKELEKDGTNPFYHAGKALFRNFELTIRGKYQGGINNNITQKSSDVEVEEDDEYMINKRTPQNMFHQPSVDVSTGTIPTKTSASSTIWHLHPTKTREVGTEAPTPIESDKPIRFQINPGEVHSYELSGFNLSGDHTNLYATLSICSEPNFPDQEEYDQKGIPKGSIKNLDGVMLYASNDNNSQQVMEGMETQFGFANITLLNLNQTSGYAQVVAPDMDGVNGNWTYEIGMTTAGPIHSVNSHPNLYLVDTDFANALFVTGNLTKTANGDVANISDYDIYIYSAQNRLNHRLMGSYCAISAGGALLNTDNTNVSTTSRGPGQKKGQYYVNSLNKSTNYFAYLTQPNHHIDNGGTVFRSVNFSTKAEENCQLIYNLDFCSDVAFAVPGNASSFTPTALAKFYDDMARNRFLNFSRSLENVACNASDGERYSLMRNCDDCSNSYKQWLCAVTIPRCTDYTLNHTFLRPVRAGESRNPQVNKYIMPGKYKEIMPCADLCFRIVQDCDPSFGFQCPKKGLGLEDSYGQYSDNGDISCSYPGAVYFLSEGRNVIVQHFGFLVSFWISFLFFQYLL